MKPNTDQVARLRAVLIVCRYIRLPEGRRQLKADLRKDFPGIVFEELADELLDLAVMVDSCFDFGDQVFPRFVEILATYEQGAPMEAVRKTWDELAAQLALAGPRPVPDSLRPGRPGGPFFPARPVQAARGPRDDALARAGGEFHWDRDDYVKDVISVVNADPASEDIRVIAIPAPREADPDRFVQYIEAKCNALSVSAATGAAIVAVRLQLTRDLRPDQVVIITLRRLGNKFEACHDELHGVADQVEKAWGQREARAELSPGKLAEKYSRSLTAAAQKCRPVILFQVIDETSEDLRSWLLRTWLDSTQEILKGAVIVLVGPPASGLDALKQSPYMCLPTLSGMEVKDLWEWAYYGHGLTWVTPELVKELNRNIILGSALKFSEFIITCKTFERLFPRDKLLELVSQNVSNDAGQVAAPEPAPAVQ